MYRIFIIEDDTVIASALKKQIELWGNEASVATDFRNPLSEFNSYSPHLVLLDISLPFYNGYHWCAEIRKTSSVPIIFISSASDNMNIVMAMNMGGDDFVAKPFDLSVLTAKITAILRRAYAFTTHNDILTAGNIQLDIGAGLLICESVKIELTKNEMRILQVLIENKGTITSRDTLMNALWETDSYIDDNTLTVNVTRLRKKLDEAGAEGFIKTKKGIGYMVE